MPNAFRNQDRRVPWLLHSREDAYLGSMRVGDAAEIRKAWWYTKEAGSHHLRAQRAQRKIKKDYGHKYLFDEDCIAAG